MDINELKKLIKNSTSVLVMENNEPKFVVLDYKIYKDLTVEKGEEKEIKISQTSNGKSLDSYNAHERETEILERLNKEILALKSQIEAEEKGLSD